MIIKKQVNKINDAQSEQLKNDSGNFSIEKEEKIDLFDLNNIDFSQRQERRRGDRRRGYRRIDDRNLISRAQEEADNIKEAAAKEGYKAGIEKAQVDLQELKTSIIQFFKAKQDVFEYIAPDILEISVDIARKIVKKEIDQNPEIVLETIMDVLKNVSKDEGRISIKVNPEQVSLVKTSLPEIAASIGIDAKLLVVPDEAVNIGSCIVYTHNGVVDATINTQLEIIKEALRGI